MARLPARRPVQSRPAQKLRQQLVQCRGCHRRPLKHRRVLVILVAPAGAASESADAGAVAAVVAEAVAAVVRHPQAKQKTAKMAEDVAAEAEAEESTTYVMSNRGMAKTRLSTECGRRESGCSA